jgi:hypothetical protein
VPESWNTFFIFFFLKKKVEGTGLDFLKRKQVKGLFLKFFFFFPLWGLKKKKKREKPNFI